MQVKTGLKFVVILVLLVGVGFLSYKTGVIVGEENILKTPPANLTSIDEETGLVKKVDFGIFWETWRKLEATFLESEKIDYTKMVYGAVEGMVDSVGDPYTVFFTPKESDDFKEELSGKYEGVGMYVGIKQDQLTIISPIKGTPAFEAGLKAGDRIIKVDDTYTLDITIDAAVSLIKGPEGTHVKLLIQREGLSEPKEFEVIRAKIKIPTLELEIIDNEIALIKIHQFNEILTNEFNLAANQVLNAGVSKMIIDLRNNPGGYLEVAQNIASWFLEKNKVVVWQDSQGGEKEPYKSKGSGTFKDYDIVVLMNQGSASASEILAGALRDHLGSQLVGETSFGKGSVQEQINLSDGSSLKVTISKWLTPLGTLIEEEGLAPDVEVLVENEDELEVDEDPQLDKAIEILQGL